MISLDAGQARRRENFPVALRVLPAQQRGHLQAAYRFARQVDDMGDNGPGDRVRALNGVMDDVRRLYGGRPPSLDMVAGLAPLAQGPCPLPDPWLALVAANLRDQGTRRYATFEDLADYCTLSANPVGEIVLRIFNQHGPGTAALSDRVCTGLQLVEHWQDVREDHAEGRVYVPQEDLDRFGVAEDELGGSSARPRLRSLLAFETDRAAKLLCAGFALVRLLRGWARLAVAGYTAGGLAAADGLARAGFDPLATPPPKPTAGDALRAWARGPRRWLV